MSHHHHDPKDSEKNISKYIVLLGLLFLILYGLYRGLNN
jgi:hypothetical protein